LAEKIKVLYTGAVLRRDWPGGEPIIAKETIEELKKLGYEVDTAFYSPGYDSKISKKLDIIYSFLRNFCLKTDSFRPAVAYYRKIIKLKNPDIIISQYDYDTSIIEAAKLENKKIIVYVHIWWPICPKITLYTHDKRICKGYLNNNCKKCIFSSLSEEAKRNKNDKKLLLGAIISRFFLRYSNIKVKMYNRINKLNSSDLIIVYSEEMKKFFISNDINEEKISILSNGINCEEFAYNKYDRQKIVLYAGGANELKGYKFFTKIAENVKKAYPEIRFVAAGQFRDLDKNTKYIEYPGILERDKLIKLMCMSRVTVVPSIWNEPFSMVTIESMACGTPVVAFDVGILKEIIGNEIGGFIVPTGDVKQAAQKVIDLLNNDDLFGKMSKNARERACRFYSNINRITSLDKMIKTITGSE